MNTLDRIVRVIYQELPLSNFTNLKKDSNHTLEYMIENAFISNSDVFKRIVKESYMNCYPNNYNPNELDNILEWVKDKTDLDGYKTTLGLIFHVVKKLLFYQDNKITVSFDNLLEWNGFINKIDSDIFYAAFLSLYSIKNHNHELMVAHDNVRLKKILSQGISENHMHLKGSGYTTDMNWYYFNSTEVYKSWRIGDLVNHKFVLEENDTTLSFDKLRIIRLFIFQLTIRDKLGDKLRKELEDKGKLISYSDIKKLLYENESFEIIQLELKRKIEYLGYILDQRNHHIRKDPKKYLLFERRLLKEIFNLYLNNKLDDFEIYLLNIYILGLSKFKMFFYQNNERMGFEKFKHSENIKEKFLPTDYNRDIYRTVFDKYYSEKHVRKIEFRIGPKKSEDYYSLIDELDKINEEVFKFHKNRDANIEKIQYGLVIHYIKDDKEFEEKDGLSRKEKMYHTINEGSHELSHFIGKIYNENAVRIDLEKYRNKIVGIDTANYELNCKPELFGEVYRRHREESLNMTSLKYTYHVGEDFNTLANGLRAIDEVIEFLQFKRGDRFGHALALGIDVDEYFKIKRYKIISTLEDYLDDIVWMYHLLKDCNLLSHEISNHLISEFETHKEDYYFDLVEGDISIFEYYKAYLLRGDNPYIYKEFIDSIEVDFEKYYRYVSSKHGAKMNTKSSKHKLGFSNLKARRLFYGYHFSKKMKQSGRKQLLIEVTLNYIEAVKMAQMALKKKVYKLEISIESNPTSNRKISYISKYIDLPMLNINKYMLEQDKNQMPISTFINTDDSAIFQTNLSQEYSYVVAALMRENYPIESIYSYIDYLRENSLIQSFINENEYLKELPWDNEPPRYHNRKQD